MILRLCLCFVLLSCFNSIHIFSALSLSHSTSSSTRLKMVARKNSSSNTKTTTGTTLVTHKMCPFAQKAWIALECFSSSPYELKEIPLYGPGGKPNWFMKLNPQGTVPVLVCEGSSTVLCDSDRILDEIQKGSLIPATITSSNAAEETRVKQWRTMINQMLPIGKRAVLGGAIEPLRGCLKSMDDKLARTAKNDDGFSFLAGERVTVADCHAFPFLWRLEQEFDFVSSEYINLSEWLRSCSKQPAFQRTIQNSWWWWW